MAVSLAMTWLVVFAASAPLLIAASPFSVASFSRVPAVRASEQDLSIIPNANSVASARTRMTIVRRVMRLYSCYLGRGV